MKESIHHESNKVVIIVIIYSSFNVHWKILKYRKKVGEEDWNNNQIIRAKRSKLLILILVSSFIISIMAAYLIITLVHGIQYWPILAVVGAIFTISFVITIWLMLIDEKTRKETQKK